MIHLQSIEQLCQLAEQFKEIKTKLNKLSIKPAERAGFFLRQTLKPYFRQHFQRSPSPEPNYSKAFRKTEKQ